MKRKLNRKTLLILLVGLLVLAGGVHFLHGAQVRRSAGALLEQAKKFEEQKNLQDAAHFLRLYLQRVPSDTDAQARYALVRAGSVRTAKDAQSVYEHLENFLRRHPERDDVRREAALLAMSPYLGRFSDARHHLDELLKAKPDPELDLLVVRSFLAEKNFVEADERLAEAVDRAPQKVEGYVLRAYLLREHLDRGNEADKVLEQLVSEVKSAEAYLHRARYRKRFVKPDDAAAVIEKAHKDAAADIEKAHQINPDHADVLLAWAGLCHERQDTEGARKALNRGIELHGKDPRFYVALSELEVRTGRKQEGIGWLQKGLEAIPDSPPLLWDLAVLQANSGQAREVGDLIDRLRKAKMPAPRLDYLDALARVGQREWPAAAELLEKTRPLLQPWPDLQQQTDLLLGRCFTQLGDTDRQYAAFQRAAKADPLSLTASLGLGTALERMGKPDEAVAVYRRIIPKAPQARLTVARLLIARNLTLPGPEQRWQPVAELLDEAETGLKKGEVLPYSRADVATLRAQMLLAQGKEDQAQEVLTKARDAQPDRVDLWVALAALAGHRGKPQDVLAVLDEAGKKLGDRVELRLARADHWSRRGKEGREHLLRLEAGDEKLAETDRLRLWRGLAEAHARAGDTAEATRLLEKVAHERPSDLGTHIILFDLALLGDDIGAIARAVAEIRRIEGPDGTFWRYGQACELLVRARGPRGKAPPGLDKDSELKASELLGLVRARRPGWSRVAVCEAEIALLSRKKSLAIDRYQKAVDQGERGFTVLRRLVELLSEQRRYDDANRVLRLLPEQSTALALLGRTAAQVLWEAGDHERALQRAEKAVGEGSRGYRDHLWLAQMLWASGRTEDANARLRKAIELAPTEPDPWVARVQFLARTGRKTDAAALLVDAARAIAPDQAPLALAQCHVALGQTEKAWALYEKALADQPKDVRVLRALVNFRIRTGELAASEPHLQALIKLESTFPEDARWARNTLPLVMAMQGDYQKARRAMDALDQEASKADSPEGLRTRALVLAAQRSRPRRLEAVRLLEKATSDQLPPPENQFLLGQLYESVGDWRKAREQMLSLVTSNPDNPLYLARYVRGLLRHDGADEAEPWVSKLEKLQPDLFQTLELKARVLKARGKGQEVTELVKRYARRPDANLRRAASLLEQLDQAGDAEELYRRYRRESKAPDATLVLAEFLGRQKRLREALDLCDEARKALPVDAVAATALNILYVCGRDPEQNQRVRGWVKEEARKGPRRAFAVSCLAALHHMQGEYAEATRLFRAALELDPNDALALNNLAWLLALREGRGAEALELLRRAEESVGQLPDLLDTQAVVHLALNQGPEAVAILEDLVAEQPTALAYFHLARGYQLTRQTVAAKGAIRKAHEQGLKPADVDPLEREAYDRLLEELGTR